METQIIIETIEIDEHGEYVIEADEKIVEEMRKKLQEGKK